MNDEERNDAMIQLGPWQTCPLCKESSYSATHRCKPEWEACDADDRIEQREWLTVRGVDAADAAEACCALLDPYNESGTVAPLRTVLVRPIGRDDLRRQYAVAGELQPVYTAVAQQLVGDE
jgi:hypothetical protein